MRRLDFISAHRRERAALILLDLSPTLATCYFCGRSFLADHPVLAIEICLIRVNAMIRNFLNRCVPLASGLNWVSSHRMSISL
jgi:hypothetical protein